MNNKVIHIVSLDVPFPPDYGGMIDVFYRIKALHELGFSIHLHCFTYGRARPVELERYCSEVHFYERKKRISDFFSPRPFVVQTRRSDDLLKRLLADEHPVLLEGLHCCWYLEHPEMRKKMTIVRTHNVEHDYYQELMKMASGFKKLFFRSEYKKLKRYESILSKATYLFAIKEGDRAHFETINSHSFVLPASLPELQQQEIAEPKAYCLFHGNLSVEENNASARWLLDHVIPHLNNVSFVIAGKNPARELVQTAKQRGVKIVANPSEANMNQLIAEARIHVLPSTQATGLKLKLLAALQTAGTVIVNSNMIQGNDLGDYCIVADSAEEFVVAIQQEVNKPIDLADRRSQIEAFLTQHNTQDAVARVFREIHLI